MLYAIKIDWMMVCLSFETLLYADKANWICIGGRIYGPANAVQDTSTPEKIVGQAYSFLERNLITGTHKEYGYSYSFSKPSSYKYGPSQWLWGTPSPFSTILSDLGWRWLDSGAHQILWARRDVNRAIADLTGMLNFQLADGRIPEMINWKAEDQGLISHILIRIQYSHITYNDLTQMPVLPYR